MESMTELRKLQLYKLEMVKTITRICDNHEIKYYLYAGTLLGGVRHKGFIPWDDDIDIALFWNDYCKLLKILKKELPKDYFIQNAFTEKEYPLTYTQIRRNNTTSMPVEMKKLNIHWGICIDIFPLIKVFSNEPLFKIQSKCLQLAKSMLLKEYMLCKKSEAYGMQKIINKLPSLTRHFIYRILIAIFCSNPIPHHYLCEFSHVSLEKSYIYEEWRNIIKLKFEDDYFNFPSCYDAILRKKYGNYMEFPPIEERNGHEVFDGKTILDYTSNYTEYK